MKISTKGRYAVRMLADLAANGGDGYTALKDIAERQGISKKYLEQIVPVLSRAGVLSANRGFQGGYKLAKSPKECTVLEVLKLTEGNMAPVSCLSQVPNQCERSAECATLFVWEGLYDVICDFLDGITIQDIIERK